MIFGLYPRVVLKLGDESYIFDRSSLMFTEVVEIEDATGLAFDEWRWQLERGSLRAKAALLHILRKRAGVTSDYQTLEFSAYDLDVAPLHDDGTEFTAAEVAQDIARRAREAQDPTAAGDTSP